MTSLPLSATSQTRAESAKSTPTTPTTPTNEEQQLLLEKLFAAASHGSPEDLRKLVIESTISVDKTWPETFTSQNGWIKGRTLLMHAAQFGNIETAVQLLSSEFKAVVDRRDKYGTTALMIAASHGHPAVVRLLVKDFKANVEEKDNEGSTALMHAASQGYAEVVWLLVCELKADLNEKDNHDRTALMFSVLGGHADTVTTLVCLEADLNQEDKTGSTAFMFAAARGSLEIVKVLLEAHTAKNAPTLNAKNHGGFTALDLAQKNHAKNVRLIEYLKSKGCVASESVKSQQELQANEASGEGHPPEMARLNPLILQITLAFRGREAVDPLLERERQYLNDLNRYPTPLLLTAAEKGLTEMVLLLISKGADPSIEISDSRRRAKIRTPLQAAAFYGHPAVVEILLQSGANVIVDSVKKKNVLTAAVEGGQLPVIQLLASKGFNVDQADGKGKTPLMIAANIGHKEIVEFLLEKNCKVDARCPKGCTALGLAISKNHNEIADLLLDFGAGKAKTSNRKKGTSSGEQESRAKLVLAVQSGNTELVKEIFDITEAVRYVNDTEQYPTLLLLTAAQNGSAEIVSLLISKGANPSIESGQQSGTPLQAAAFHGHLAVVEILFKSGANFIVDSVKKTTALMTATKAGHLPIVEFLVNNGFSIDQTDAKGTTSLMFAADMGHEDIVRFFLEKGCKVDARGPKGSTALTLALSNGYSKIAKLLIDYGASVTADTDYKWTPLMMACQNPNINESDLLDLLASGSTGIKDFSDNDGLTALSLASFNGNILAVEILLRHGCDVNVRDRDGCTHLIFAAKGGHYEIASKLLENTNVRNDVNASDKYGRTALMYSSRGGYLDVTELLVDHGADINALDKKGWNSLMFTAQRGHTLVAQFLLEKGAEKKLRNNDDQDAEAIADENDEHEVLQFLRTGHII